jgi:MATE family multidrug resistance protein
VNELKALTRLALPIVISQVAQSAMGIVDTVMVGPLGASAVGAVGLGAIVFTGIAFPLSCLLLGLDAEVSQAFGASDRARAEHAFAQALYLAAAASLLAIALLAGAAGALRPFGVQPALAASTRSYILPLTASIPAFTFHFAATKFLQGSSRTLPVMWVAIGGNVLNAIAVRLFVFHFGFGIPGAAIGTTLARFAMAAALMAVAWPRGLSLAFARQSFMRLLTLGIPAALQVALEVGIFVMASVMVGRFDASWMAAHHLVLQMAALSFMFPLGISQGAAVRVGDAIGAGEPSAAARRGWIAIATAAVVMSGFALIFASAGPEIAAWVLSDPQVIAHVRDLTPLVAAFQLFDGLQVTTTGALRGLGDTRTPFVVNLVCYWFVAMPLGLWLAFSRDWGPVGIWCALSVGLTLVGSILLAAWARRARGA